MGPFPLYVIGVRANPSQSLRCLTFLRIRFLSVEPPECTVDRAPLQRTLDTQRRLWKHWTPKPARHGVSPSASVTPVTPPSGSDSGGGGESTPSQTARLGPLRRQRPCVPALRRRGLVGWHAAWTDSQRYSRELRFTRAGRWDRSLRYTSQLRAHSG